MIWKKSCPRAIALENKSLRKPQRLHTPCPSMEIPLYEMNCNRYRCMKWNVIVHLLVPMYIIFRNFNMAVWQAGQKRFVCDLFASPLQSPLCCHYVSWNILDPMDCRENSTSDYHSGVINNLDMPVYGSDPQKETDDLDMRTKGTMNDILPTPPEDGYMLFDELFFGKKPEFLQFMPPISYEKAKSVFSCEISLILQSWPGFWSPCRPTCFVNMVFVPMIFLQ